jgi:methylenetetrahydrofolate dehydrogenase (NADP+)/methenyltetrahydrofolate cyclohydrolase
MKKFQFLYLLFVVYFPILLVLIFDIQKIEGMEISQEIFKKKIINGKHIAEKLNEETKRECLALKEKLQIIPKLVLILVGDDPASLIYTSNKKKKAEELGMISENIILPKQTSQNELNSLIENLSKDKSVHGILLQMPLPHHLSSFEAIRRISPEKDVDGFHPFNSGLLNIGKADLALLPCTPQACVYLLESTLAEKGESLASKHVLIVGRSNIVGWPLARLLLDKNAIITVSHSFAPDLKKLCLQNDIIISATGKPFLIKADMVREGQIIIDVGINRIQDPEDLGKNKLVGDVDFDSVLQVVSKITPVPGGVGPMTIAFLMKNVLKATYKQIYN